MILLTGDDKATEDLIEQQLRELTLLPLNIRYLTLQAFQKEGHRAKPRWLSPLPYRPAAVLAAADTCR